MTSPPPRRRGDSQRWLKPADDSAFDEILEVFGSQLQERATQTAQHAVPEQSEPAPPKRSRGKKLKGVTFEYEKNTVHDMAGDEGYSLSSNWFIKRVAQLGVARRLSASQIWVFLYVVGCQEKNTGITYLTQQQITDGLNEEAARIGARCITRNTVGKCLKSLCDIGWLEQITSGGRRVNGQIRVNPRLWFRGDSTAQQEVLFYLSPTAPEPPDLTKFPYAIGPDDRHQEHGAIGEANAG
ncbi:hypothetical protein AB0I82_35845 [Streptomyces sp. NPDC050315]|uniref:hypothetical protein n=1 Tax=Streptomyces sp. NPDC050315 TaxID=3155039 RepID=UPI00342ED60F